MGGVYVCGHGGSGGETKGVQGGEMVANLTLPIYNFPCVSLRGC